MNTQFETVWSPVRLFEDIFAPVENINARAFFTPPVDVEETENHYVVKMDVPGVAKEDLKIEMLKDKLSVSGERKWSPPKDQANRINERVHGKFERSVRFNAPVDAEKIEASYVHGVLEISVPKAEIAKPRQIEIKAN